MTLDERIAQEKKAAAFHEKAMRRKMPHRALMSHSRKRRAALAMIAVLEKVKQLQGM